MTTLTVNKMPNITWHQLKMNWTEVDLPDVSEASSAAVDVRLPTGAAEGEPDAFDAALAEQGGAEQWESGMGADASAWLHGRAATHLVVDVAEGASVQDPVVVRVSAQEGTASVACVDVVARAGSSVQVALHVDGEDAGTGVVGVSVRVLACAGAAVQLDSVQTLSEGWIHLDDFGAHLGDDARLRVAQTVLGAAESYTGLACNLSGVASSAAVDTRYLGHGAQKIDFNYVMRQRGAQSTCTLTANGVLMDSAGKVLRGTIDLINGAKGAVGQENETVLLVSEDARNKTVPIILCDEDDVQGAHGATIGHVNPEQFGYLQTRGLDAKQAEDLFAVASFDYAAQAAFDEEVRAGVRRVGAAVLGDLYAAFSEVD